MLKCVSCLHDHEYLVVSQSLSLFLPLSILSDQILKIPESSRRKGDNVSNVEEERGMRKNPGSWKRQINDDLVLYSQRTAMCDGMNRSVE